MEWSKAKIYMIIAFLVTNLLLIMSIWSNNSYYSDEFDKKSLKDLRILLEKKDIKCEEKLSTKEVKLPALEIIYANVKTDPDLHNISEKYKDDIKIIDDMYLEIHIDDKELDIDSEKKLEGFARKFIDANFKDKKYKIKSSLGEEDYFSIDFEQVNDNVFIDEGYLKFASNEKNTVDISIFKTNPKTIPNKNIKTISNAQAVSKIIPKLKLEDVINSVDLGYARPKENFENNDDVLRYVRLTPYWRIKVNSEKYFFVEAVKLR